MADLLVKDEDILLIHASQSDYDVFVFGAKWGAGVVGTGISKI